MTKREILKQIEDTGMPKKVEVFVCGPYADHKIETHSDNPVAIAFKKAAAQAASAK